MKKLNSLILDQSPAFILGKFGEAQKSSKGKGIKVAVIDSGWAPEAAASQKAKINHVLDFSLIGRTQPPWSGETVAPGDDSGRGTLMALMASRFAPEAEIRTYRTGGGPDSPYEYWPAMELAQAIYKAAYDGNDFILTGAAFSGDFPFLKQACQFAYLRNVIIIAPNGLLLPGEGGGAAGLPGRLQFGHRRRRGRYGRAGPSHPVGAVLAVQVHGGHGSGLRRRRDPSLERLRGRRLRRARRPSSRRIFLRPGKSFPDSTSRGSRRSWRNRPTRRFSASRPSIPRSATDSSTPRKAVGPAVQTYIKKMNELDADFNKRMAQRAKEAEEAEQKEAAEKEAAAKKK